MRMGVRRLTTLPVEVLSRILGYVDNSDITAVKKTCQTLCSVTMTRQFWYHRICELCEEKVASPPEEELEKYTIAELEQWTMRRIRARSTSLVTLQLHSRTDPMTEDDYVDMLLVPGGRWLLKIRDDLRVYFVDLDSSNLEQHLLLDSNNTDPRITQYDSVKLNHIWTDRKAPRLSFRLEVSFHNEGDIWVYIYQVNLVGHGASATLVAQIIATFRRTTSDFFHDFSGHYVVSESTGPGLEIFDYRQALGCFDYPLIEWHTHTFEYRHVDFKFINEDVLAVYDDACEASSYRIYNIESSTSLQLLHKIQIPAHSSYRFRWTPKAALITFGETIFDIKSDVSYFISGLHGCGGADKISHFDLDWDYSCESPSGILTHIPILDYWGSKYRPGLLFDLDEDTGRFIHFYKDELSVVDIVAAG